MDLPGATDLYLMAMDEIYKFPVWQRPMVCAVAMRALQNCAVV